MSLTFSEFTLVVHCVHFAYKLNFKFSLIYVPKINTPAPPPPPHTHTHTFRQVQQYILTSTKSLHNNAFFYMSSRDSKRSNALLFKQTKRSNLNLTELSE